jgi:hypothetical protein
MLDSGRFRQALVAIAVLQMAALATALRVKASTSTVGSGLERAVSSRSDPTGEAVE